MTIPLPALRGLCNAMRSAGITRYKWRFERGPVTFEAIFIIEDSPYELLLGAIGTTFGLTLQVHPGFRIETTLPTPDYYALCDVLQLTRDPGRKFKPADFFDDLNRSVPQTLDLRAGRVQPHDVIAYRRNVEEADKKYFMGWKDNTPAGENVSPGNLQKTLEAFGRRVFEFCQKHNISSRWTADPSLAKDYHDPA